MQGKEERLVEPKSRKLELLLLEVIQDLLTERQGEAAECDICKVFYNIVSIADSVSISSKTEKSINRKIKSIKEQAVLFGQFYLNQVAKNLSDNEPRES